MKQTTTTEQTFTLIKLGFDKPKHFIEGPTFLDSGFAYTIGDLIEMLDSIPNNMWNFIKTSERIVKVEIHIFPKTKRETHYYEVHYHKELIDALFDMIVKLKEEGVI